ncbi:MAG: phosphoglycerate kinase [Gammaproteobacteria bacterium]
MKFLNDIDFSGKSVLLRLDLNTPIHEGRVSNNERILRSLKTINFLNERCNKIIIISHLGRPKENNQIQEEFTLRPVAKELTDLLGKEVVFADKVEELKEERITLLENIRFLEGEKANSNDLSDKLALLSDVFVFDAFATAHRAHASTTGVINYSKDACAGFLVQEELESLDRAFSSPRRPLLAVIGGSKVSTKLGLLTSLVEKVDHLILGGGIANTCLLSQGRNIGKSLAEETMTNEALALAENDKVLIPDEFVVSDENQDLAIRHINEIREEDNIFDVSENFFQKNISLFQNAGTIVWNGPLGLIEDNRFLGGTKTVAKLISRSQAFSVIGGGDTILGANKANVLKEMGYVSTAGGAFLEYLEGKELPAISALKNKTLES